MPTDIEIAQRATLQRIGAIAAKAGIPDDAVEPYGHYKAKISLDWLAQQPAGRVRSWCWSRPSAPRRRARARPRPPSVWVMR